MTEQAIERIPFQHVVHKHCESGVVSNMLRHYNVHLSEPMVFGMGAGLYFAHTSFIKALGAPVTSYRYYPGEIFKTISKLLNIEISTKTFRNKRAATVQLNEKLAEQIPVGLLADMYYLDYMPDVFRFHFAAHNLIVYGKENDSYCISDPIVEIPVLMNEQQLLKARFGKGLFKPKAKMYWIKDIPRNSFLPTAILKSTEMVCKRMTTKYYNWVGYLGMKKLARSIAAYPEKHGEERASFLLLNVVRMQEVVGTGGAGFRPIYADFLKEAAAYVLPDELHRFSEEMSVIAHDWRMFALMAARCAKRNNQYGITYKQVSECLFEIAEKERSFFIRLNKTVLNYGHDI